MAYAIYQTEAFVLKLQNTRESSKQLFLYTERFGFLVVHVQSSRVLESKLRYHLNRYSFVFVDLVRGKYGWRLTGVQEKYPSLPDAGKVQYRFLELMSDLIFRFSRGEEANEVLWGEMVRFRKFLMSLSDDFEFYQALEIIFILRVLAALGYGDEQISFLKHSHPYHKQVLEYVSQEKKKYIMFINKAFTSSQL